MSYSPFACNWQNRFWDSEPAVARFPRNKGGNSDIWIPHNTSKLHLAPCMHDVCHVHGLGPSSTSKQNVLSLILLILLVKLTNQKRGIYRYRILYPLQLKPPFPIDAEILRFKVVLGPNQMLNWLEKCWNEKYKFNEHINLFVKIRPRKPLACTHRNQPASAAMVREHAGTTCLCM